MNGVWFGSEASGNSLPLKPLSQCQPVSTRLHPRPSAAACCSLPPADPRHPGALEVPQRQWAGLSLSSPFAPHGSAAHWPVPLPSWPLSFHSPRLSWRKGPVYQARRGSRLLASRSWTGIMPTCAGGTVETVSAKSFLWVSSPLLSTALTCGVHSVPTLQIRKLRPRPVECISQGHRMGRNVASSSERWQGVFGL